MSTRDSATSISPVLFGPKQMFFREKMWKLAYSGPKCIYNTCLNKTEK